MLVGRDSERRLIESLLADARAGRSAALVVRGVAGIGKTALLEEIAGRSGAHVLGCVGVQSEHDLPFAGLQRLLSPAADIIDRLPELQAAALRSAFGISLERVEGRLVLGLATLNLLAETADDPPLLCLIDDLQWLDGPSAQALLFAARRLGEEGIVMVFAVRDDPLDWYEVPEIAQLTLEPLADDDARDLIAVRDASGVTATAADALLREAAGNPLALMELPLGTVARGASGVEAAFRARLLGLPAGTRRLLLVAASAQSDEAQTWIDIGRLAGVSPDALAPAVAAGLVGDVDVVLFRHPLVRSATYNAASAAERREAHRLLAESSTDELARASHRAAAAAAPDELTARELESAASAATHRGGFASAATAFARAATLSGTNEARVRRLAKAAQAALDAGRGKLAATLVDEALAADGVMPDRAALAAVQGALAIQGGTPEEAYERFSAAARLAAAADPAYALVLQGSALGAALFGGWPERVFDEAQAFVRSLPPIGTAEDAFWRAFLDGAAALMRGASEEARTKLQTAVRVGPEIDDLRILNWVGLATVYLGDVARARAYYARTAAAARSNGSFNVLPQALLALAQLHTSLRSFSKADEYTREGIELSRQLGQANLEACFNAVLVRVLAARGEEDLCREVAEETLRRALAHNLGLAVALTRLGLAELEVALGNGAAACQQIDQIPLDLARVAATPDYVEASLLAGDRDRGRRALDAFTSYTQQAKDPHFTGLLVRCNAQLETSAALAEARYQEAVEVQVRHAPPFDRARTELSYGEFLRRAGRRTDARTHLGSALATFEGLGTPLWAARARAELEATGMTARKRDPSTLDSLTPQELRIARLVSAGVSNRDVAAQLFLSPKTVEYHLRKVFLKLGVSSRVGLARIPFEPVEDTPGVA
jgi:DNA-binding CsgD family transcriptional regulator